MSQPNIKEIDWVISELLKQESSFKTYAHLADLYTVREHLNGEGEKYLNTNPSQTGHTNLKFAGFADRSEFLQMVSQKDQTAVWSIMDELMETLQAVNPRVYNGVIRKIESL